MPRPILMLVTTGALLAATACGGSPGSSSAGVNGPGNGSQPIAVAFSQAKLTASYAQGSLTPYLTVTATLSALPTQSVYVVLAEDSAVLQGTLNLTHNQGTTYSATIQPSCLLSPGDHAGTLTLQLCLDAACAQPLALSGNTLPYDFTVTAGHLLTAKVDGVAVPGFASRCTHLAVTAKVGQVVEVDSTVGSTWNTSFAYSSGTPTVTPGTVTPAVWTGTMGYTGNKVNTGVPYGSVFINATPTTGGASVEVPIDVVGA